MESASILHLLPLLLLLFVFKEGFSGPESHPSNDICQLPLDRGHCKALLPKFWFNATSNRCERFWYSGCGGNSNMFRRALVCFQICGGAAPSSADLDFAF